MMADKIFLILTALEQIWIEFMFNGKIGKDLERHNFDISLFTHFSVQQPCSRVWCFDSVELK